MMIYCHTTVFIGCSLMKTQLLSAGLIRRPKGLKYEADDAAWVCVYIYTIFPHHLLALATMTPLSMEKASLGSPAMFHARILMGSPSVLVTVKSEEQGIFRDWHFLIHSEVQLPRYADVKAPRYEITPDATSTSPVKLSYVS